MLYEFLETCLRHKSDVGYCIEWCVYVCMRESWREVTAAVSPRVPDGGVRGCSGHGQPEQCDSQGAAACCLG